MVIALVILVVISCLTISWYWINNFIDNHNMLEQDEIVEIFEINKEHFENIKNTMSDFSYDWNICKNREIGSGWKTCAIKGDLYLGIRRQENFDQLDIMRKNN